jgi:peroxiredoxin
LVIKMSGGPGPGKAVAIALVATTMLLALCFGESDLVGDKAPNFTVVDVDDQAHNLTDYRGKVLVVEFFATWCTYCSQQLDELKDLRRDFTEVEVAFLMIDIDDRESEEKVRDYRDSRNIGWPVAPKGEKVGDDYDVDAVPTTAIIDGDGVLKYLHSGVVKADKLKNTIQDLL